MSRKRTTAFAALALMALQTAAANAGPVFRTPDGTLTSGYSTNTEADPPVNGDPNNEPPPPPFCYYDGVENNYDGPCVQAPH